MDKNTNCFDRCFICLKVPCKCVKREYKHCDMEINGKHKSALYLDMGLVRCQNCGNKVGRKQAQKFLEYNNIQENNN